MYRYILQNKSRNLVLLKEEIDFLNHYFQLLKMRFEDAVNLDIQLNENFFELHLVPPISLQVLAENAIKHNEFSKAHPITIQISLMGDELMVHNRINKKILPKPSSKIGLTNLAERYKLTTQHTISIKEDESNFTVYLPLLKIN